MSCALSGELHRQTHILLLEIKREKRKTEFAIDKWQMYIISDVGNLYISAQQAI